MGQPYFAEPVGAEPVGAQELNIIAMPSRGAEETEEEKAEDIKGVCVWEPHGV